MLKEMLKINLNTYLINKYKCFQKEQFWLDSVEKDSITIACPTYLLPNKRQCSGIANNIYKWLKQQGVSSVIVLVGGWFFLFGGQK